MKGLCVLWPISLRAIQKRFTNWRWEHTIAIKQFKILLEVKRDFDDIVTMPGVVGCVYCTYIHIHKPLICEKAYINRKNYHSINV